MLSTQSLVLKIWTKPRETIRRIVDTDPRYQVITLAMLGGIAEYLSNASSNSIGDRWSFSAIVILSLIFGPISGIISLYIAGFVFYWTGRWLGGRASAVEVRAVVAWASVPAISSLLLLIPELVIFQGEMFTSFTPRIDSSQVLKVTETSFDVLHIGIGIWTFIIFLHCLGEVHGFSAWRALGSILLILVSLTLIVCVGVFLLIGFMNWVCFK